MDIKALDQGFARIKDYWSPHILAAFNNNHIKLARVKGEFIWHVHNDTDEVFIIHKGALEIHYRDRVVSLEAGDVHVVSKGVEHKPVAAGECEIILIEPAGTPNTGDGANAPAAAEEKWL